MCGGKIKGKKWHILTKMTCLSMSFAVLCSCGGSSAQDKSQDCNDIPLHSNMAETKMDDYDNLNLDMFNPKPDWNAVSTES